MKIIRNPIFPDNNYDCNNRNIHEYSPYKITNHGNIIDENWYNSLTDYCKSLIKERTNGNYKLGSITIPHEFQYDNDMKFLTMIYKCYIDSFDYNIWYQLLVDNHITNIPEDVKMYKIPLELKRLFVDLYGLYS